MTLEEAKKLMYEEYMTQVNAMNNTIEHPEDLRSMGYKTLEEYLVRSVTRLHQAVGKIMAKYERDNP